MEAQYKGDKSLRMWNSEKEIVKWRTSFSPPTTASPSNSDPLISPRVTVACISDEATLTPGSVSIPDEKNTIKLQSGSANVSSFHC